MTGRPILIALGANLPSPAGTPRETCERALEVLEGRGVRVLRRSRWFESAPDPPSGQPWYVNGVASVTTDRPPEALLSLLHEVERDFGRVRRRRDEERTLDLDLLAYGDEIRDGADGLILPHPRLHRRAFVLRPLAEVAPRWRHPVSGRTVAALLAALPAGGAVRPLS